MTVIVEANLPYFEFTHNNQEFVIHLSLMADEPDLAYQINLSPVIIRNHDRVPGLNVAAANATERYVNDNGGVLNVINETFIPRVNAYLKSLGGGDGTFPADGTDFEQWVFLLENSFAYANGQILLIT
ncbi:MAG: hypothetical protein GY820_38330 [Gammaproteobacteria bacterium]|nr:hypothetical protein [Gammaproteobacteria bacterium]